MKEYIFNALTENHFIAQRVWDEYIKMGIWFPVIIVTVILLMFQYKRLKKKKEEHEDWGEFLFDNPKYLVNLIPFLCVIIYVIWLVLDIISLGNSIILYEIKH